MNSLEVNKRPRVLVIAEAANPEWVSVPLIGWSLTKALRAFADVHLVTHVRNRDAILRAGWKEGEDFTAIDSEAISAPLWKLGELIRGGKGKGWTSLQLINVLSYPYFEHLVWKQFKARIRSGEFDIVHRVTPLSPTINSSLAHKVQTAGIPFVMGPLNGGVPWPEGFERERRKEREWLSYVRGAYKLLPGRKRSLQACAAIIAGSGHTLGELPESVQDRSVYIPENAVDPERFSFQSGGYRDEEDTSFRACFVGRLVPYKGPDMLLEAAEPFLKSGQMSIDFLGSGPMLESLIKQADPYLSQVTFHGWVNHRRVQHILAEADLFAFPSIREFGGGVVLEAMALNVPCLVVDYAGPGELVQDGFGLKVPIGSRAEVVASLRDNLASIMENRAALKETAGRAQAHVLSHLTWESKASQICDVYDWVLGRRDKPEAFKLAR